MNKHPALTTGIYSIRDLKDHYARKTNGHWFDADTMRFFNSRVSETLVYDGTRILFFTSELGPAQARRMYSIREYDTETGRIETVGVGFQGYKTLATAKRAAKYLVEKTKVESL